MASDYSRGGGWGRRRARRWAVAGDGGRGAVAWLVSAGGGGGRRWGKAGDQHGELLRLRRAGQKSLNLMYRRPRHNWVWAGGFLPGAVRVRLLYKIHSLIHPRHGPCLRKRIDFIWGKSDMRFRVRPPSPWPPPLHLLASARRIHAANSGDSQAGKGKFLLPGATAAVLVMLGALHARRMYDDKKAVQRKEKGIEPEFSPGFKASLIRLLPLRSMSRFWGSLMEVDIPVFMRPTIYKAWARAFHSDLQEVALPLEEYPSLQAFFIRSLKEGARPIDPDPNCLVSPVDGKVLRLVELRGPGTMIEQVKGFSYSVSSLLGTSSSLHNAAEEELSREHIEQSMPENSNAKSWWRVSVASPKLRDQTVLSPKKGHLLPQNERAIRTIRNLYVENERVVLEGRWKEGFVAIAAIGATNVGSIRVNLGPELRTNRAVSRMVHSLPPEERVYEPEGTGVVVKKIAGFKMGSTVVVVFEAPAWKRKAREDGTFSSASGDFGFCVRAGDKVRPGEAIGRWSDES